MCLRQRSGHTVPPQGTHAHVCRPWLLLFHIYLNRSQKLPQTWQCSLLQARPVPCLGASSPKVLLGGSSGSRPPGKARKASQLPPGPPWHRLALERALPATTWKLPGLKVHVSYLIFQCSAVLKVLRLDHMQWPSHPFTPTASDSAEIPTRFLSALPATPWQGLTEGKERDRAAEMHKLRINSERENMLRYHSLHASVKPRKKYLSMIFSQNSNVCSWDVCPINTFKSSR